MVEDLSGQTHKGYKLLERIGGGGHGTVYRAMQSAVGREVAVKVIRPDISSEPAFIRRFELEAQLIARLEHLHIVPLYDFWRDPNGAYLVMRWLRAGSLAQVLEKGPLDLPAAVRLVEQVASGLSAAHSHRIVHRDLKPANILLDEEGNAYLSDFGIARDLNNGERGGRRQEGLVGSLDYLAPEQARGQAITPRTDLYSLGVTLYEALTGQHPFPGLSSVERLYKHIEEPLPPIENLRAGVDSETLTEVNKVIQRSTAKDPQKRYGQVLEMAADFRDAARLDEDGRGLVLEETLTQREQEILAHIVEGHTNRQIAQALFVELPTVKWHITHLYQKMGVRSRMQAIVRTRELGLLTSGEEEGEENARNTGAISIALGEPINPYKGLRPFEAADSRDFFGREVLVEQLLERLGEAGEMARFLAIVGPSGSGKSSLLSAGLAPAIWAGKLPDSERWFVVEMAPGARPLDELEVALTRIAAEQAGNLHAHLKRDAGGLLRAAGLILPKDGSELLLIVDQFEELFTLTEDEAARDHFLNLLYGAVIDPRSRVRVVIALRADFYDRPLYHPGFGALVKGRMETLLPLSAEELERAIRQPAGQVGVTFEPGLAARIMEEILYQPGALPLLQYALTELFEGREERVLSHRAYEAIGGAVGALAQRADEVYLGFDEPGREAARQMFLRLVNLGDDGTHSPDTRRQVLRTELQGLVEEPELMEEVIDTFGAFRMLSLNHEVTHRQPTVELAHEALITEWERLEEWLEESRDDLGQQRRFQALAGEWEKSGREPGYLLREARLDQFAGWAAATDLALAPDEQAFLAASVQARESRREEEEERRQRELETAQRLATTEKLRAEEQSRANRRLRWLAAGLAVFLLAAIGAALFARMEGGRAERQARLAFARELAAEANAKLDLDPELSIHLALGAVKATYEKDGTVLPVAEEALHRAVQASRVVFALPEGGGLAFSPDGEFLVTGGSDGSLVVWDARSGERIRELTGQATAVRSVTFSRDGSLLATAGADHQRIVWDFASGRPILELPAPEGANSEVGLSQVEFSPDGQFLLSTGQFAEARIWEVASGREVVHFDESAGPTAAFSPDGRRLALMTAVWDVSDVLGEGVASGSGDGDPTMVAWSERLFDYADPFIELVAASSELASTFREPGSVSYSPDGSRLLTTVVSTQAVIRDAATGERLFILSGHTGVINGTAFGPNGDSVATAGADKTARVWDAATGELLLVLEGHQDEVVHVAFSPDGQRLASSSLDGTTRVWDITAGGRGEWPGLARPGRTMAQAQEHSSLGIFAQLGFHPQEPQLVVVGQDAQAAVYDIQTKTKLFSLSDSLGVVVIPTFSPDGKLLALAGRNTIHLLDASNGGRLHSFQSGRLPAALAFSPDGKLLFTGSQDGVLSILDLSTGKLLVEWVVQEGFVNGLAFGRDGETLVIAGADGKVVIARLDLIVPDGPVGGTPRLPNAAILTTMTGHTDVITDLDQSLDGKRYLTASWDGTARVWEAGTGELLLTLAGHRGRVWSARFAPDGASGGGRIVTAGADGLLILWDGESGEQLYTLDSQPGDYVSLAFSSNAKFLAAAGSDGQVRVYVMPIDDLMALARGRLTRALSEEECRRYFHEDGCS